MTTFYYSFGDDFVSFHAYTKTADEARKVKDEIQSLAGSMIEQDGDFVYCMVDVLRFAEACDELREAGCQTEEI